jgi:hypothetical protein
VDDIRDDDSVVDAYFYPSSSSASSSAHHSANNSTSSSTSYAHVPAQLQLQPTTHRQRVSMQHPGAFHLPWTPVRAGRHTEPPMTPIAEPPPIAFDPHASWVTTASASTAGSGSASSVAGSFSILDLDLDHLHSPPSSPPASPRMASASPTSPMSAASDALVLKVASGEQIVLVRVPRGASLLTARARIASKLAAQDAAPRSPMFALGLVPPPAQTPSVSSKSNGRPRSGSVSSIGDGVALRPLVDQRAWEDAVRSCVGGKLALRVIDVPE